MEITIVTSSHNYGRYLADWANSILALTLRPAACVIVDNGSTDGSIALAEAAAIRLDAEGISTIFLSIPQTDFGTARNAAVALAATEWVMHLDADDMVMPHCLEDVARLAPDADVVSLGYERSGDLKSGPRNRTKLYRTHHGAATLADPTPSSGVSPFRRSFWERSPYRTDMTGGWDTALWLGFAHLGARFVPTRRPCFWYRQHADSVFNTRRVDTRKTAFVGSKLQSLRRGDRGVSVLVPWSGSDGGPRQRSWEWLSRHYASAHPDWEVVLGTCPQQNWRKGVAVNDALSHAHGSILIIADADCFLEPAALAGAVELVEQGAPWVVPHTLVNRLSEKASAAIYAGEEWDRTDTVRKPYAGFAGGGFIVVERAKFEACCAYPEHFKGWGAEDEAMALILDTLVGQHVRLPNDLWHLWHPAGPRSRHPDYQHNRLIYYAYAGAAGNPDAMWDLLHNFTVAGVQGRRVRMVALVDIQRDGGVIKAGQPFLCTAEEARREAARGVPVAVPSADQSRTEIDLRQLRRQQLRRAASTRQQPSFEDRRLAAAGQGKKRRLV
jgi:hypothetical protein